MKDTKQEKLNFNKQNWFVTDDIVLSDLVYMVSKSFEGFTDILRRERLHREKQNEPKTM